MDQTLDCNQVRDSELIEGYLDETLSPDLRESFEKHYLGCQECFEELQFRHALRLEIANPAEERLGSVSSIQRPAPKQPRWIWAVAALILLAVIPLSLLLFRQTGPNLPSVLLEVQEMPVYLETTVRGGQPELAEGFRQGMQAYQEKNYAAAVDRLAEVARAYPEHLPTAFYLGVSCLATNQPECAVESLTRVVATPGSPYLEEARWYLAKSYFRLGRIEQGKAQLEALRAGGGAFAEDAARNLQALEESLNRKD